MTQVQDFISNTLGNNRNQEVGIGDFKFFARVNDSITLNSEAPTNFLEDGSFASDHIIKQPIGLTIEGKVSDIFIQDNVISNFVNKTQEVIGVVTGFLPPETQSQVQQRFDIVNSSLDKVREVEELLRQGEQLAGLVGIQSDVQSHRKKFLTTMESYYSTSQLVSIEMKFKTYSNMALTSIVISRSNDEKTFNFKISAQEIRSVEIQLVEVPSKGLNGQTDSTTDKGPQDGKKIDRSVLDSLGDFF